MFAALERRFPPPAQLPSCQYFHAQAIHARLGKCHTWGTDMSFSSAFEDTVGAQRKVHTILICSLFFLAVSGRSLAQRPSPGAGSTPTSPAPPIQGIPPDDVGPRQAEMAKKANQQRQVQLKSDTDKLVKLAGELKAYVDKTNENMLSLDVMKKAEEIEKLAHSVREKMKGSN
jgi:hypothetical protein